MARTARPLLTVLLLGGMLALPAARAQAPAMAAGSPTPAPSTPAPSNPPGIPGVANEVVDDLQGQTLPEPLPAAAMAGSQSWEPEMLKYLPQPPDQPRSLFAEPAPPGPPPPNLERYFDVGDPLLDPPQWGKTGWFTDVQLGFIHPHENFGQVRLIDALSFPGGQRQSAGPVASRPLPPPPHPTSRVIVAPGAAQFDWTVAPRLEIGYRFPSGFGGISFSDRFFSAYGTNPFVGPAGVTTRTSSLGINWQDWDYISREFTPWNNPRVNWSLEWRAGIRLFESWTNTRVDKPFAAAASSDTAFIQGSSVYDVGAGPHFGVVLERKDVKTGISGIMNAGVADEFTRYRALLAAAIPTLGPNGKPERSSYTTNFWNQLPILTYQVGMGWQPPSNPNFSCYVGYYLEYWYQFASNMGFTDPYTTQGGLRGTMQNQGVVIQAQWKW